MLFELLTARGKIIVKWDYLRWTKRIKLQYYRQREYFELLGKWQFIANLKCTGNTFTFWLITDKIPKIPC